LVVVLPTPPFWFATVKIRVWSGLGKILPVSEMRRRASIATSWAKGVSEPGSGNDATSCSRSD